MFDEKELSSFLSNYNPCDVSDALVSFGYVDGGYIPDIKLQTAANHENTLVGPAYTVQYTSKSSLTPAFDGKNYIDTVPESSVILISAGVSKESNALFGGLMARRALYRAANGAVIDGRIRDISEQRDMTKKALKENKDYFIFAKDTGTAPPGSALKVIRVNTYVELSNGYIVYTGDFIIGNENGVVVLPTIDRIEKNLKSPRSKENTRKILDYVIPYIPKRTKADQLVAEDINQGKPAGESQKLRRKGLEVKGNL